MRTQREAEGDGPVLHVVEGGDGRREVDWWRLANLECWIQFPFNEKQQRLVHQMNGRDEH